MAGGNKTIPCGPLFPDRNLFGVRESPEIARTLAGRFKTTPRPSPRGAKLYVQAVNAVSKDASFALKPRGPSVSCQTSSARTTLNSGKQVTDSRGNKGLSVVTL